jgi:hypothetical protein
MPDCWRYLNAILYRTKGLTFYFTVAARGGGGGGQLPPGASGRGRQKRVVKNFF